MMDYRALEALVAVLECRGFERAAQRLNVSQSAVSQRIRQLEFRLGQPVLLRTSPPRLTDLGQRLTNHLQQVQQLEQGLLLPQESAESVKIRLAVNADTLDTWLAAALLRCDDYVQMDFDFIVEDQDVGLKRMRNGEVMACICATAAPVNGGLSQPLGVMRYRALASPEFIRRHQLKRSQKAIAQLPCLIFSGDDRLQHRFLQSVSPEQAEPQRTHQCPSSGGFVRMALAGIGYGMIPQVQVAEHIKSGELRDVVPGYHLDVPLYWHYWQTESLLLKSLRSAVVAEAKKILLPAGK
ncbi:LysR family transcriptional regulator ArgP [Thalassolituus sp. UBA2009]|uniref:LysR family transcriptional regulator ArgP n=1 Tax=Thalassolituus sp. UBA2009 TaxID=1947658 RepID=UPI002579528E|nr:LysR family transcriptional regulator ArgP [Thalassolituus sp. UBA2009]